ncbi:MAG: hypothetical protein JXJ04_11500 [Spirochaetales bacterium]|nr:hypothetical protein [Spirochaetales bacterium]
MSDEENYPPICPKCGKEEVEINHESEYTGGGYADYWDEFECMACGYIWRSDKESGYS